MAPGLQSDPAPVDALASISVDCPDPAVLADFSVALLGMRRVLLDPAGHPFCLTTVGAD